MEGKAGLLQGAKSAGTALGEVDHLAPVEPGVDPADLAAAGALEVRGNILPVPIGKFDAPRT